MLTVRCLPSETTYLMKFPLMKNSSHQRNLANFIKPVRVVKNVSVWADRLFTPRQGLTIVIYHRVGAGTDSAVDTPVAEFTWQMEYLAESGIVVTFDEGLRRLLNSDPSPGVVVTFDDGTADFTDVALPIMAAHGIPSLLYAETGPITTGQPNASGHRPTSWASLRDASSTGLVTVGSHTHTHRMLQDLDKATAADELDRSIEAISEHLGYAPAHFAYPKAVDGSAEANDEVRCRFRSAALGGGRSNLIGVDPFRLQRTPIQRSDSRSMFESKIRGGMRLEGALRGAISVRRYRNAVR